MTIVEAFIRVVFGLSGPFTRQVYGISWVKRPFVRVFNYERILLVSASRYLTQYPLFHVVAVGIGVWCLCSNVLLDRPTIVTTTATLLGLIAIVIALTTVLISYIRGYGQWLWLAVRDSGITFALFCNFLTIFVATFGGDNQTPALALFSWLELLRSVFVSFRVLNPDYLINRAHKFALQYFSTVSSNYIRDLYPLGIPSLRVKGSFLLRLRLAKADLKLRRLRISDENLLSRNISISEDGRQLSVCLFSSDHELANLLSFVNERMLNRFLLVSRNHEIIRQLESHCRWFSENAADAAEQSHWTDFESLIRGYISLTSKANELLINVEQVKHLPTSAIPPTIYTWNAPSQAFDIALASVPTSHLLKVCQLLSDLFTAMNSTAQSIHDYVDLLVIPSFHSVLFKCTSNDIETFTNGLGESLHRTLIRYANDESKMSAFFIAGKVIPRMVKALRVLQSSFSGVELQLRQRAGIIIIKKLIEVGEMRNNTGGDNIATRLLQSHLSKLLEPDQWDSLIGDTEEQGRYLILSFHARYLLLELLESVQYWT